MVEGRLQNLEEIISDEMFKSKYSKYMSLVGTLAMLSQSGNNNMYPHKRGLEIQLLLISFLARVE